MWSSLSTGAVPASPFCVHSGKPANAPASQVLFMITSDHFFQSHQR
jgi:hypothetical protein